ncbi:MAG: TIM barrel protein [Candidatus Latescibacteria bacterium]|jgi:mannonate dehydratase|nr:TIM barrel protein [Candidatus Latescibacterota bacterium]
MHIQDQLPADRVTDENLRFYKSIGVDYLTIYPPPEFDTLAEYKAYFSEMKKKAETHGLILQNIATKGPDEITLGLDGRDRKLEQWKHLLCAMGATGIPTLGYNFKPIGNFRTPSTYGRGGASYSTFDYESHKSESHAFPDKEITEERLWDNMVYFLSEIIPVAEENNVKMALHPDDPPIPEPLGGAARIVSTIDQYNRIFDQAPSDSNAMLFCQGCVAEMGVDVYDTIRDLASRDKIVYVHFRNIHGGSDIRNGGGLSFFQEVFLDEGDVDMVKAMETYRDAGFRGPYMMDHTPVIPGDREGREGHAFATGYIRALLQTVYR